MIAPDCWSLCVMRAERVKDHSDYEVFVSEEVVCGCVHTHVLSHAHLQAFPVEDACCLTQNHPVLL